MALSIEPNKLKEIQEIIKFCGEEDLMHHLFIAFDFIGMCFRNMQAITVEVQENDVTDNKWLVIAITILGEVDEVLKMYDRYTCFWTDTPWSGRDKIRLIYNII